MSQEVPQLYVYCFRDGPYGKYLSIKQHPNSHLVKCTEDVAPEYLGGTIIPIPPETLVRNNRYFENNNIGSLILDQIDFSLNQNYSFWTMLINFIKRSTNLKELEMSHCTNITPDMWNELLIQLNKNSLIQLSALVILDMIGDTFNRQIREQFILFCMSKKIEYYWLCIGSDNIKTNYQ